MNRTHAAVVAGTDDPAAEARSGSSTGASNADRPTGRVALQVDTRPHSQCYPFIAEAMAGRVSAGRAESRCRRGWKLEAWALLQN